MADLLRFGWYSRGRGRADRIDHPMSHGHRSDAIADLCCLLTDQGVSLADVTPALLHLTHENRKVRAALQPGNKAANRFVGRGNWSVLHLIGHFPSSGPQTMREALYRGQLSVTELVDPVPDPQPSGTAACSLATTRPGR